MSQCSICFDNIIPGQRIHTPCDTSNLHVFHRECFNNYRKSSTYIINMSCPMCRSNITLPPMRPIGTNKGRILHSTSINKEKLVEEKTKLNILRINHFRIEENIKIKLQNLNIPIPKIKKNKLIVNKENIAKQRNQIEWLIEVNINKQLLEEEYHIKYIQELYQSLKDKYSNFHSQYSELIIVFQDLEIIL